MYTQSHGRRQKVDSPILDSNTPIWCRLYRTLRWIYFFYPSRHVGPGFYRLPLNLDMLEPYLDIQSA